MQHYRYGDLKAIARKTSGRCHICRRSVEVCTHGLVGLFGREAATVDHLLPQSFGGGDDFDNLLLAHHGCNAARGNGSATEARLRLAGTPSRPLSTEHRVGVGIATGGASAFAGGWAFARVDESGTRVFNQDAAVVCGLLGAFLGYAAS